MALYKVSAAYKPTAELQTFVGEQGELFYSEEDPRLRISDGITPGGIVITTESTVDLSALAQHIIPAETEVYDLGSPDYAWRDLYLSGNTLYIGGEPALFKDPETNTLLLPGTTRIQNQDGTTTSIAGSTTITQEDIDLQLYIEDLLNIDVTNAKEGSLLQLKNGTWTATNEIESVGDLTISGGTY